MSFCGASTRIQASRQNSRISSTFSTVKARCTPPLERRVLACTAVNATTSPMASQVGESEGKTACRYSPKVMAASAVGAAKFAHNQVKLH